MLQNHPTLLVAPDVCSESEAPGEDEDREEWEAELLRRGGAEHVAAAGVVDEEEWARQRPGAVKLPGARRGGTPISLASTPHCQPPRIRAQRQCSLPMRCWPLVCPPLVPAIVPIPAFADVEKFLKSSLATIEADVRASAASKC